MLVQPILRKKNFVWILKSMAFEQVSKMQLHNRCDWLVFRRVCNMNSPNPAWPTARFIYSFWVWGIIWESVFANALNLSWRKWQPSFAAMSKTKKKATTIQNANCTQNLWLKINTILNWDFNWFKNRISMIRGLKRSAMHFDLFTLKETMHFALKINGKKETVQ